MNPITFSTLACPDWPVETVIANAADYGYDGIEWRGGMQGHLNPALPPRQKAALREHCANAGLFSLAVTAYTTFVSQNPKELQANVDELKRYLDLAAEIGAHFVRTFIGELPPGVTRGMVYPNAARCLEAVAAYAATLGVTIAIEPHDDFVLSTAIAPLLERISDSAFESLGVIWDIGNAYGAGEDPAQTFPVLRSHLAYVQVKDGVGRGDKWRLTDVGVGDVPLQQAVAYLAESHYSGALSLEWERAWHPELAAPELALPAALKIVRMMLAVQAEAQTTQ